ncbi:hypothetical protein INT47_001813 [Mucor saturninus]|uniref:Uncharacterized protein n=1 Tax=Mucor saturninus TaxID=64648 RepID=A0A8H7QTV6_9FUNG|nr:hypothetical protein INT47_001813 [Mucor saturninus]
MASSTPIKTAYDERIVEKNNDTTSISLSNRSIGEEHVYFEDKTSLSAWLQTAVCVAVNGSCAIMWMTSSSVPAVMSEWMGTSLTQLNWLSNASAICNTLFSLPTAWVYEKYGIKNSIIICAVFNAIGCWIRCLAIVVPNDKKYTLIMLGQIVSSIAGPLVYNVAAKLVALWFAPKDRGIANIILSIQIGMALAPLILPIIAPNVQDVPRMLIIVASFATVCALPTFFLPSKPKNPPSASAMLDRTPFWKGVKQVCKNMQFWWVATLASVTIGMVFTISVLVIEAITPYGYTDQQAGLCASVIVISGCFGGGLTGYWLGKSPQHFMLIKTFTPLVIFTYVMYKFELIPNAFPTVLIACILNGFFSYALFPVYLELASEITYPVSESISSCIIWSLCTMTMLIFSVIIDALKAGPDANPPNNMNTSMLVVLGIVIVGNLPSIWIKGDLKRLLIDNKKNGYQC